MPEDTPEPRTHCIRCGTCCTESSPTLHTQDVGLVTGGHLKLRDLYTIRRGELVWDPVRRAPAVNGTGSALESGQN